QVYNKSRVLYGLYQARQAIRKNEEALLVEGYTDVVALHQAGIEHAVASSGTALTREQVELLGRYAKRIILIFDSDAAGMGAAMRAIDIILPRGLSVYIVELPSGEDPDSFARKEGTSLQTYLDEHRVDFISYIFGQARKEGKLDSPEGEAETMHGILEAISRMPDPLMQESYLRRASEVLEVSESRLHEVLDDLVRTSRIKERRKREPAPLRRPQPSASHDSPPVRAQPRRTTTRTLPEEKTLIRLMFEHGSSMIEFILGNTSLDEFTPGAARHTAEHFLNQYESGKLDRQLFIDGTYGEDVQELVAEVSVILHEPSRNWERKQRITVLKLDEDLYESA
ncbi:MAG: toprim domain-containing protein, partial [Rhodothermales bacterium]